MREDWKVKKLGDVCDFQGGSQPPKSEWVKTCKDGYVRMLQIRDFTQSRNFDVEYVKITPSIKQCSSTDILIGRYGASVGKILSGLSGAYNVALMKAIPDVSCIISDYIKLYFCSPYFQHRLLAICSGRAAQAGFSKDDINDFLIPVPPLQTQQQIVEELDSLTSIIDKQKKQLEELDNLAQSIFYDMFGDPIVNEKGWKTSTIDNVCSSIIRGPFGSALKKEFFVEKDDSTYKVYEQKNAIKKDAFIGTYYISKEMYKSLSRFEIFPNDIIMSCSGTIGELFVIPFDAERGIINQALLKFTLNKNIEQNYFLFMMNLMKSKMDIKGCGIQNIGSVRYIKATKFGLPPLTLQQEFASKIEAIENQKKLIKKSIEETEELFNSRMDYYFN